MAVTNKIDKNSKISIPKIYLAELELKQGDKVEISLDQKNKILIIKKGDE